MSSNVGVPTAADQLSERARACVDDLLQRTPPLHVLATEEEIATYLSHARDALAALETWNGTRSCAVVDQLETVAILRVLVRLDEIHCLRIECDDASPTLFDLLSRYRTCVDRVAASLACTLVARLCAQQVACPSTESSDVRAWVSETLADLPPPPPTPSSFRTPEHASLKRMRLHDESSADDDVTLQALW